MSHRFTSLCFAAAALSTLLCAADETVVFKSDVALVRVDAQVLDRSGRAITGLRPEDFVVFENGKEQQIRNFARENMPVDVLFLIDVSGSMQPHVQRLASAAHSALSVLGEGDRVGIMVFDRQTRIRMRLTQNPVSAAWQFDRILQDEGFNGGTDITRGLLDAASYIGREGRKDARRAIVILTDDQTEKERDDARVGQALTRADAVLMALIAPDAMSSMGGGRYPRGGGGGVGGGYPQGGGYPMPRRGPSIGGGLGGIIFGGPMGGGSSRYPQQGGGYPPQQGGGGYPPQQGGGYPGGVTIGGRMKSAGTSEIARESGGDSASIDSSGALEDTLERIRNRYALYFYLPQDAKPGTERNIEVALTASAKQRFAGSEVRFRQRYLAPGVGSGSDIDAEPVTVSKTPSSESNGGSTSDSAPLRRRRPAVDDTGGSRGPNSGGGWPSTSDSGSVSSTTTSSTTSTPATSDQKDGWKKASDADTTAPLTPAPATSAPAAPAPQAEQKGGWRRVKPGEQP